MNVKRWAQLWWVAWMVQMMVGCGGASKDPAPVETSLGDLRVRVDPGAAKIEVRSSQGEPVLIGLAGGRVAPEPKEVPHVGLAVRHAEAVFDMLFGSFYIEEQNPAPWVGITRFSNVRREADGVRFDLVSDDGQTVGSARIAEAGPGELTLTFAAYGSAYNRMSVAFACEPDEHFLGFGGQSFDVDHRGQTVPLWVQEDGIGKAETDEYGSDAWFVRGRRHSTHTPMPMFVSSRGYGMLLDTPVRSLFAMGSEDPEVMRIEAWEDVLHLHLFWGPQPSAVLEKMTAHVGRPELPPPFAFAPWLDAIYGSENVRRVAQKLRDEGVPSSVIWTEDWRGGSFDDVGYTLDEDWNVDRELYPDFELLAQDLHRWGYKFLTYNNTFISKDVDVYDTAIAAGYCIHNAAGEPYLFQNPKFEQATMLDLTAPGARSWAKRVYAQGLRLGADGYMADYAEWLPVDAVLYSGLDAMRFHNLYPVEFQRLNRELFDALYAEDGIERLFFVRSAYLGSQPLVSVVWAGDQQTDFSRGDGLPSVIPIGIGLGMTGFPYFGHDISGYLSYQTEPASRELWYRWVTFGALSPVMRTHHGKSAAENWNWERDDASTEHFKRWATLHIRLFPYLYELARRASAVGMPMMRPLALKYPDFEPGWSATDQYMLGDRIIVAPVVTQGATARTVALPPGRFFGLLDGQELVVEGDGRHVTVEAPLRECPAFVEAGTVLVLLPADIDTLVDRGVDSDITTLADVGDDREVWVWPGGASQWTEVSGLHYAWDGGQLDPAAAHTATFNGASVDVTENTIHCVGNGTLVIDETATLEIEGGASDRTVVVRLKP